MTSRMSAEQIERWANYAVKIQCKLCGEDVFAHIEDARDEVEHVAQHYDLGPESAASEWRLYLIDRTGGLCDYCEHMTTKDD